MKMDIKKQHEKKQVDFFDKISDVYPEIRPGYNEEIYKAISQFIETGPYYKIVEIGAGNGIATERINEIWNGEITLIEPSKKLSYLLKERFKNHSNKKIINEYFEKVKLEKGYFDAIFSATSFHWLDGKTKFRKYIKNIPEIQKRKIFVKVKMRKWKVEKMKS
ncbi:MAG TPA: hypothetical protein DDZ96_12445 [Porphyromonadaceae bacterium]|jgi:ubiquinone/menaquinone biosynthesis C-methylase UbiE|nr:hypothetical protein [Porphyromonadaceae bacterium]HBL34605.1 hypothetical protein [Porphyromonadaceae bacterium]HBX20652.1 hypothetical protein [Porphyromonadaceae bacterium]HBX46326.1 hypothetical protein [Porphyromonadaceae bacterium]HCM19843.1 hypothetical protein [Porphyromonadaceae bacterium]